MKYLGCGLGLRADHYPHILSEQMNSNVVSWFEALTENYMGLEGAGAGRSLKMLEQVREKFPVVLHGVSLSIGSSDPLNLNYLKRLKNLIAHIEPEWISDHLCWTGVDGVNLHDLMPLPYTRETLDHVVERVGQVQGFLGRKILLENVSSYIEFKNSEMPEWEFISEISRRSGCELLLDVNNIYVSSVNHSFDPLEYLYGVPKASVGQIHLAGHSNNGTHLVDTHDEPISEPVWNLFEKSVEYLGLVSTMVERDDNIPSFEELEKEVSQIQKIQEKYFGKTKRTQFEPTSALV